MRRTVGLLAAVITASVGIGVPAATAAPSRAPVRLGATLRSTGHPTTGQAVAFSLSRTLPASDHLAGYTVSFGDVSRKLTAKTSHLPASVRHTYGRAGRYTVTLTVTDSHHHSAKATHTVVILPKPAGGAATVTTTRPPVTTTPALVSHVTSVVAGVYDTCAVISNGTVRCWGDDDKGQLGVSSPADPTAPFDGGYTGTFHPAPVTVPGVTTATAVAVGVDHTCALLASGGVTCWGDNSLGQLGDGSFSPSSTPVAVQGLPAPVISLSTRGSFTCAALKTGAVYCWGLDGLEHYLGDNDAANKDHAVQVMHVDTPDLPLTDAFSVSVGGIFACATISGAAPYNVECWGNDSGGAFGTSAPSPSGPVSAGSDFACGTVVVAVDCWGSDEDGQTGATDDIPYEVAGTHFPIAVSTGGHHACVLLTTSTVKCWGDNEYGQLTGTDTGTTNPQPRDTGLTGVFSVSAGDGHTCALLFSGTVECWGNDTFGELGPELPAAQRAVGTPQVVTGLQ